MNSVQLFQHATGNWLAADDVAELSLPHVESLGHHLNSAVDRVWRRLPAHYRQRPFTQSLKSSATGTATVTNGQDSVSISISGADLASTEWQHCTIEIGGVKNQVVNNGVAGSGWDARLLHRWAGATGTYAATIYQDAAFQPLVQIYVDRFVSDLVDTVTGAAYSPVPDILAARRTARGNFYTLTRRRYPDSDGDDFSRDLLELSTSTAARTMEASAEVMPLPLGVADASVAKSLPYDDATARIIADAVGLELVRHPKFRGGDISLAREAMDRLARLPQRTHTTPGHIGTPTGW